MRDVSDADRRSVRRALAATVIAAASLLPLRGDADAPAPTTAWADTPRLVETVVMPPGTERTSTIDLDTGTDYHGEFSGTITVVNDFGDDQTQTLGFDAFWWFSDSRNPGHEPTVVSDPRSRPFDYSGMLIHDVSTYQPGHVYRFRFRPQTPRVVLSSSAFCGVSPGRTCGGPGITLKIYDGPIPDADFATLVSVKRKVEVSLDRGGFEPARAGMRLRAGDQIHTGFGAAATLRFPGGSEVTLEPMSLVRLDDIASATGTARLFLDVGKIAAEVNRITGAKSDFEVKTPTTTCSVRGTVFEVTYDTLAESTLVAVRKGVVDVTPLFGEAVEVRAGREVESTGVAASAPVKRGTAGRPPGGVTRAKAIGLVLRRVARAAKSCGLDPLDTSAGAVLDGETWRVSVTTTRGPSQWTVIRRKVVAADGTADELRSRCK